MEQAAPLSGNNLTLAAVYKLPAAISFVGSCLGTSARVCIAGLDGTVHLPRIEWHASGSPDLVAPIFDVFPTLAQSQPFRRGGSEAFWYWGMPGTYQPKTQEVMLARVDAVGLLFRDVAAADIGHTDATHGRGWPKGGAVDQLYSEIDNWFERLRLWVRAIVNQDVDVGVEASRVSVVAQGLEVVTIDGDIISAPRRANNVTVITQNLEPLDDRSWERALRLTNRGMSLPVEWSLVGSARVQVHLRQFRRAVVDAAAAVELSLATYLNSCITTLPAGLQTTLSTDSQTLGWLIKTPGVARNMPPSVSGIWQRFPSDVQCGLLDIRNDVVHRNHPTDYATANRAVEIAAEVVKLVTPLPI